MKSKQVFQITFSHLYQNHLQKKENTQIKLYNALSNNELDKFKNIFIAFFASIPHDWYRKNNIEEYEGFYASIFYTYFSALGLNIHVENPTSEGRLDMVVHFKNCCYIFEFKINRDKDSNGKALQQIKEKNYAKKFTTNYNNIYLVGIEFDTKKRNIAYFEWEKYNPI